MTDLFGRPIYDAGKVEQPPLFSDRHWFRAGYEDAETLDVVNGTACKEPAYRHGYAAGLRDLQDGRYGVEGEACAWRAAVAVGNVQE